MAKVYIAFGRRNCGEVCWTYTNDRSVEGPSYGRKRDAVKGALRRGHRVVKG